MLASARYRWGLDRLTLVTTEDVTTGNVVVTNGSTTVTSVDSDGDNANNFGSVTTSMFIRVGTDKTSYKISSIDTDSSPDTLVIENAYVGTTATAASYVAFQDTYTVGSTDMDELKIIQYGDGRTYMSGLRGSWGDTHLEIVSFETLSAIAGGDLHRDTSGKPSLVAEIAPDSSNNRQFVLWPYPKDDYILEGRYSKKFTEQTSFSTVIFGSDAPDTAYDVVEAGVCARVSAWDNDPSNAARWDAIRETKMRDLLSREARTYQADNAMQLMTFRKRSFRGMEVRSQIAFDYKSSVRH